MQHKYKGCFQDTLMHEEEEKVGDVMSAGGAVHPIAGGRLQFKGCYAGTIGQAESQSPLRGPRVFP